MIILYVLEWVYDQGGWELDENIELAASRETLEEAGVIGSLGVSIVMNLI